MMLIKAAYPKRLGTPQRRKIEAEETPASADCMTSPLPCRSLSPHSADAPRRPLSRSQRGRCVWLRHHALRPKRIQQQRRVEATGTGHGSGNSSLA